MLWTLQKLTVGLSKMRRRSRTAVTQRGGYETLFDDDVMTVFYRPGRLDACVVSFTGVGHGTGGIDVQNPEFARSGGEESSVFVIDKHRSWGNALDWEALKRVLAPVLKGAHVTTLGNSMGGFLAIYAARDLGATEAIAFAPQWSVDPKIIPDENRWKKYRRTISEFRIPDLSDAFSSRTKYFVLFGNDVRDYKHVRLFAKRTDALELHVLDGCDHDVARFLKDKGQLYAAINACRAGGDVAGVFDLAAIRRIAADKL